MKRFLVIQTAFIGDVVLSTAVLEKLHHYFPHEEIDILVRKGNEGLMIYHPFLHEVLIWDKKDGKYKHLLQLLNLIRKRKYDKVINLQRFASSGWLTAFSGAKEKIGFKKNPLSFLFDKSFDHNILNGVHEVQRNNQLIAQFTDEVFNGPKLYPSEKDYEAIRVYQEQKYICILPSSVWFTISVLSQSNRVKNLAGELSFLESAALMKNAAMNYTNDSAPLHLASAMNAPVTSIFCSTVPSFGFYPLSDNYKIIETKIELPCKPCGLHGWKACPLGHFKCAYTIENNQLLETLPDA